MKFHCLVRFKRDAATATGAVATIAAQPGNQTARCARLAAKKVPFACFFYPAHCAVGFVWQASESARVCVFLHSFPLQKSDNTV